MSRPPRGIHFDCAIHRVIDGDTVIVTLPGSDRQWHIRLIDCWAAERNTDEGKAAKRKAEELCSTSLCPSVQIPAPRDVVNLLGNLTFDRIPGHLWLDDQTTLNEAMVASGFATKEKT